mgnify:CR=1 FL=1
MKIKAVVFDWAGTIVDFGSLAPMGAFVQLFKRHGVAITIEQARPLEELETMSKEGRLAEALIPAAKLMPHFPSEIVDITTTTQIRNGRDFRVSPFVVRDNARYVKAVTSEGELVAIGEIRLPNLYHPVLVF